MKKRMFLIICIIFVSSLLVGCSSSSGDTTSGDTSIGNTNSGSFSFIKIDNAQALFIARGTSVVPNSNSMTDNNTFFKITDENKIEKVKYYDEQGKELKLDNKVPKKIYNVNSEYLVIVFDSLNSSSQYGYLAEKSSGNIFDLTSIGLPQEIGDNWDYLENPKVIQTDRNNNMYYMTEIDNVNRIIKVNLETLSKTVLTSEIKDINYFIVDKNGNLAFSFHHVDSYNSLKTLTNGDNELNISRSDFWIGLDKEIYIHQHDYLSVEKTISNNSGLHLESYGNFTFDLARTEITKNAYKLRTNNKVFLVKKDGQLFEVYNSNSSPTTINFDYYIDKIEQAVSTDGSLYFAGFNGNTPVIVDYNDEDYLTNGEYKIYEMVVSAPNEIIFNALRLSDNAIVIGKINTLGEVKIINDMLDEKVKTLKNMK